MDSPNAVFKKNVREQAAIVARLKKKYVFWSGIRVMAFLFFTICIIYFANARNMEAVVALALIFPVLFGLLIKYHNKIAFNRDHADNLKTVNQQETLRLQGNLKSFDTGAEYIDPLHPLQH